MKAFRSFLLFTLRGGQMMNRILHQFTLLDGAKLTEVDDSHSSTVFQCTLHDGEQVFLKIPYTKLKFERELEAYQILKGKVSIPELIDDWAGDRNIPGAFLLSKLKGTPLSKDGSTKLAYEVGVVHASIHSIEPPENLLAIDDVFSKWSSFIEEKFYSFAEDVKDVIELSLFKQSLETFEKMKRELPEPDGPSFIHMDFRPANIIVNDDHVVGIIDFESVRFGSTEVDFTKIYRDFLSFDPALTCAYEDGYNSVRPLIDLEIILPFYQFTDAFNSLGWCKRRGMEKHKRFFETNLNILQEMLVDSKL